MLDRIRGFVKQLELPQGEDENVVYRIIDNKRNAIEVTASQYAVWRMQYDVAKIAVVGQDTVGNVLVRTTFSIMPESRSYKPFGTSAFLLPDFDPVTQYSQRYDTWLQSDLGHRETVRLVTRELEESPDRNEDEDRRAEETEVVMYAVASGLPGLFVVEAGAEVGTLIRTPWVLPDGTHLEVVVEKEGDGFRLSSSCISPGGGESRDAQRVNELCAGLGASYKDGSLSASAVDVLELPHAIATLAQAIACVSWLLHQG